MGIAFSGNAQQPIRGLATLKEAQPDQVAFLANRAYLKDLATTKAAAVLLHPEYGKDCPVPRLEIDNPYLGYAKLSQLFDPLPTRDVVGIHPTAVVADDVQLGAGVSIQAHAVIEAGVVLGDRVVIGAGSVVGADSQLGERTRLHANVTVCHGVV
ncbi:LpxD N-terminal domain-containing protein, partial [Leclercia adecarboxylata]|uniref:LpxD N-terminal domain-containing protein n=1 Tax=Leclercia adecarboxylata TaxID=83655 RepID=UPI00234D7DC7